MSAMLDEGPWGPLDEERLLHYEYRIVCLSDLLTLQPSSCCRIGSCIILKLFLIWVLGNSASGDEAYPVWKGWVIAASLGCTGYLLTLLHHQIFWCALPQYQTIVWRV